MKLPLRLSKSKFTVEEVQSPSILTFISQSLTTIVQILLYIRNIVEYFDILIVANHCSFSLPNEK